MDLHVRSQYGAFGDVLSSPHTGLASEQLNGVILCRQKPTHQHTD